MPILPSSKKALRQSKRRTTVNQRVRSRLKTFVDRAFSDKNLDAVSGAYSAVDRAVKKNLMHKNKAARLKSQLSKTLISTAKIVDPTIKTTKKSTSKAAAKKKVVAKKSSKAAKSKKS